MDAPTSRLKSLSPTNQFSFACPIFGAEVALRGCVRLNDLHMVAQGPETRRGCQAAMSSCKCPVWHMVQLMRGGRDEWHSDTPHVGVLGQDVISRIARIQTSEKTIAEFMVPAREGQLLLEANSMWEKGVAGSKTSRSSKPIAPRSETISSNDEVTKAAKSGDLAAALNAAARDGKIASAGTKTTRATKPRSASPARAA